MEIRPAVDGDLDQVGAIYAHEVDHGHATFDLEPPPRSQWESKLASDHPGDHFLVAVGPDDRVLGFAYSGVHRSRAAYTHTRETTVYVARDAGGQGVGRRLYDDLLARLVEAGVHTALAGVALPNDASEALHGACGFERLGVMREVGHKFGRWIDVAWWQKLLDGP